MGEMSLIKKIALSVGAIALFGCIISGIRLIERSNHARKVGEASKEAEDMTLTQLIARGPDGNAHVRVTEVVFDHQYLHQTSKSKYGVESIDHIWAVARIPGEAPNSPVRALVKNTRVSKPNEVDQFLITRDFKGLVINKIDRPKVEEVNLLRGAYPDFDPDKVVLIEAFREPPGQLASFNAFFSFIAGSIALACLLVVCWDSIPGLTPRRKKKKKRRRKIVNEEY